MDYFYSNLDNEASARWQERKLQESSVASPMFQQNTILMAGNEQLGERGSFFLTVGCQVVCLHCIIAGSE